MTKMLGFFFAIILTVLIFTTVYVQRWNPFSEPQLIRAHFDESVEGLRKGDDIRVDGIVMGKVQELGLADQGGVVVTMALDKPIELYRGDGRNPRTRYEVKVESISFLGGNHISIQRGDPDTPKADLTQVVVGSTKPSGFEQFGEVMAETREDFKSLIANMNEAFGELKKTAVAINEGRGTIGALLHERKLHDDAVAGIEQFKIAITEMREALGGIAQKLASTETTAGKLLNTSELHDEMTKTLAEVRKSVNDTTAELRALVEKAKDPNAGPVGAFMSDTALREDLQKTADNLKEITEDVKTIADQIASGKGSLGKIVMQDTLHEEGEKTLANLNKVMGPAARSTVHVVVDSRYFPDSLVQHSRVGLRISPDESKYFYLGGSFIGLDKESDVIRFEDQIEDDDDQVLIKIDASVMYRIPWFFDNHVGLRVGMLEGKPGGALEVDFDMAEGWPVHLEFEMRDGYNDLEDEDLDEEVRGSMTRAFVRLPLWSRGDAWWQQVLSSVNLFAGVSRIHDDPEFLIGIGLDYRDEDIKAFVGLLGAAR